MMSKNDISMENIAQYLMERVLEETDKSRLTLESFEADLLSLAMQLGRAAVANFFALVDHNANVKDGDATWRAKERVSKGFMTRFGGIEVLRWVHQRVRNGATRSFVEERLGIIAGFLTPLAAKLAVELAADLTTRDAGSFFNRLGGMTPSRSTIQRLVQTTGREWEEQRLNIENLQRNTYVPPRTAKSVAVMLDGVMVHMVSSKRDELKEKARGEGRKIGGPVGDKEASAGVLVFYDAEGNRLSTRRFARMPEADKGSLKETLRRELANVRLRRPDIAVVAISDGAPNNWTFLESLGPDHQIVDFYHTVEHIKRRLDTALEPGSHENQRQLKALRRILRDTPNGHVAVFARLTKIEKEAGTYKERKTEGRGAQPTFYERHAGRMDFAGFLAKNLPIGSGVVEGTVRHIVVDRLRRTGMRWTDSGGQAVLTIRAAVKNSSFDTAWGFLFELGALIRPFGWGGLA